jgi:hypothetical protein
MQEGQGNPHSHPGMTNRPVCGRLTHCYGAALGVFVVVKEVDRQTAEQVA